MIEQRGPVVFALLAALCVGAGTLAAQRPKVPPVTGDIAKLVPPVPTPASFIADVPGVVAAAAKATVDARIRALQDSGYGDIGIAILPSIGDYQPYEVGLAIYRTWRVGRVEAIGAARRDLGVLLLIVPKELAPDKQGQCWITTGTGAEGIITDAVSGAICRDSIIPHLRNQDYGGALLAGVEALGERLRGDAGLAPVAAPDAPAGAQQLEGSPGSRRGAGGWFGLVGGGFLLLLGGVFGVRRWRRNRPRRCPRCGKLMERLTEQMDDGALEPGQQVEEKVRSVDYDVWRCTCGETLVLPYKAMLTQYKECKECHRRTALTKRTTLEQPTYSSQGRARDTTTCKACGATSTKEVTLPKLTRSSSGSSGGSSFSSSGGGGGGSFGGSGSSSGGGGGSRY